MALSLGQKLGERLRRRWRIRPAAVLTIQFALAIYSSYFGGAVGIMMMAVWRLLDSRELKSLNAPRTLLVSAANAVAVLTFILAQAVHWHETIIMLVAATLGGYGGAQLGRRAPAKAVRAGTVLLTSLITLAFFARAYLKTPT